MPRKPNGGDLWLVNRNAGNVPRNYRKWYSRKLVVLIGVMKKKTNRGCGNYLFLERNVTGSASCSSAVPVAGSAWFSCSTEAGLTTLPSQIFAGLVGATKRRMYAMARKLNNATHDSYMSFKPRFISVITRGGLLFGDLNYPARSLHPSSRL